MRLSIFFLSLALCLGNAAAFAQGSPGDNPAAATTAPAPDNTAPAAAPVPAASAIPAGPTNPPSTGPQILIATSMGDITVQLDAVRAPKSVSNILRYVRAKHYDGTVIYRVVKDALIEMGSWDANVKGRPGLPGPKVPLEVNNGLSNLRGSVALARSTEPDSAGADFFINVGDESPLDAAKDVPGNTTGYAVFGQVIAGMDVVDAVSKVSVGQKGPMPGEAPVTPILIKKIMIVPGTGGSAANAIKPPVKKSRGP